MQIEQLIAANTAAIEANTEALKAVLAAGGITAPSNVVPIIFETLKPAAKATGKAAKPTSAPEPEPVVERPTKVSAPAESTAPDPLDPETKVVVQGTETPKSEIDVDATIQEIVDTFKAKMTAANDDPARKAEIKDAFPKLRSKWGLVADAKLITLAPTPEKLVGLLGDIEAL